MPSRNWRAANAIVSGLLLFFCVTVAVAQEPKQGLLKGHTISQAGQQSAQDVPQAASQGSNTSPELLSAIKGIEAAIREQITKEDKAEGEGKEQREAADLKAQQEMALWAERMVWASVAGLLLTLIGLLMLAGTLYYTRSAASSATEAVKAANDTNSIVARTARVELRAYISVLPAGINELIGTQEAMGHVDVRNVGKLPARNVVVQVRMKIDERERSSDERASEFPVAPDEKTNIDRAILPGTQMRQGAKEADTIPVPELLAQNDRYVYVWGIVYYDDGYKRRFTRFRHRYAIASHRHDQWNRPARETREIISVDKARYDPYGNSAN